MDDESTTAQPAPELAEVVTLLRRIVHLLEGSIAEPGSVTKEGPRDVPDGGLEPMAYSPPDAALLLGVGRSTVYELIRTGELPAIKIRDTRRITRTALEAYIERRENV